jgi:hypothetical protein
MIKAGDENEDGQVVFEKFIKDACEIKTFDFLQVENVDEVDKDDVAETLVA